MEARNVKSKETRFTLIEEVLYKIGFSTPLLHCIVVEEAQSMMVEIHDRVCENHFDNRSHKVFICVVVYVV